MYYVAEIDLAESLEHANTDFVSCKKNPIIENNCFKKNLWSSSVDKDKKLIFLDQQPETRLYWGSQKIQKLSSL